MRTYVFLSHCIGGTDAYVEMLCIIVMTVLMMNRIKSVMIMNVIMMSMVMTHIII